MPRKLQKIEFCLGCGCGPRLSRQSGAHARTCVSFVSLGSGVTGPTFSFDQVNTTYAPFAFRNIYSNDVMIGMRWNLMSPPPYAPPLVTKG